MTVRGRQIVDSGLMGDSVNSRIDAMGKAFNEHTKRIKETEQHIQKFERAYMVHISENMKEYTAQVSEMDKLRKSISAGPIVKRECTVDLAELRDKIVGVKEALDDIEATLYMNVTAELNDDNKPAFTNDTQRKYALTQAKRACDEYQDIKAQLDKLGLDKARLDAQLREIEDTDKRSIVLFRGCVARVENVTARISL